GHRAHLLPAAWTASWRRGGRLSDQSAGPVKPSDSTRWLLRDQRLRPSRPFKLGRRTLAPGLPLCTEVFARSLAAPFAHEIQNQTGIDVSFRRRGDDLRADNGGLRGHRKCLLRIKEQWLIGL